MPTPTATVPAGQGEALGYEIQNGEVVQKPTAQDYTLYWWRDGFNRGKRNFNILTGYYGLVLDTNKGQLINLGALPNKLSMAQAQSAGSKVTEALPGIKSMGYTFTKNGSEFSCNGVKPVEQTTASRILESGTFMQRVDVLYLSYQGDAESKGRLEVAATPRQITLEYSLYSELKADNMALSFSITMPDTYKKAEIQENGRAAVFTMDNGSGVAFYLPERDKAQTSLSLQGNTVTFSCQGLSMGRNTFTGFSAVAVPFLSNGQAALSAYVARTQATISAVAVNPNQGQQQPAYFDQQHGYYVVDINKLMHAQNTDFADAALRDSYDRVHFTLKNTGAQDITVPVQFLKTDRFGVTGFAPFLRNAKTGEPIGVPVQLTKNWHQFSTQVGAVNYMDARDPRRYWEGSWFHGYTLITVPAGQSVTYELTLSYANWGGVYAASHAQITLAGWGGNYQQWETSSVGSFGEAFCYDPESAHGRSFIDDIRPLNVTGMSGRQYDWTGCNGGGQFLIAQLASGEILSFKEMNTWFQKQGPNLTEVHYTGLTGNGAIKVEIGVYLQRTNDTSRAIHTFKYTFLKKVQLPRLVLYSMGADNYNDNQYTYLTVGDNSGPASFSAGGNTYSGTFEAPVQGGAGSYVSAAPITLQGDGLWFANTGAVKLSHKQGPVANRMVSVLSFKAQINGTTYSKPAFNIRRTNNYQIPSCSVELMLPGEAGKLYEEGSVIEGAVEYINLPKSKSDYFGPSAVLNSFDASVFNTAELAYAYAMGVKTSTTAKTGTVVSEYPIRVATAGGSMAAGGVAAEITVTGGISYVPLTFTGLPGYAGYQLQTLQNGNWVNVDQSVHGNDYWQCWYNPDLNSYELTYNVEHANNPSAQYSYRLVKG